MAAQKGLAPTKKKKKLLNFEHGKDLIYFHKPIHLCKVKHIHKLLQDWT